MDQFRQENTSWLQAKNDATGEIVMVFNKLLTKTAESNIEKVCIENEFLLHGRSAKILKIEFPAQRL
jgi:hypothetical protein